MNLGKEHLLKLYTNLVKARAFDRAFARLLSEGKLLGFYHPAEGGEAPGVGACSFLNDDDFIWPHIRGHGIPHMISKGIDIKYYMAEHTGKSTGMCGGISSFHGLDTEHGMLGWAGTIGSSFPVSVGWGITAKKNGRGQVVVSCFGDGTSNRGTLHESFLMAANWNLPIVWVCENNGLGMYMPVERSHPVADIADLAHGYGMPGVVVDGQDVVAVAEAVDIAVERARSGKGPSMVECKCYRFLQHAVGMPDMVGKETRTEAQIAELRKRDPIILFHDKLLQTGILTEQETQRIDTEVAAEVEAAEKFADESPLPDPSVFDKYLYAE